MKIRICKKCGFILNTRPHLKEINGVCMACINNEKKKDIDFIERQAWLTTYISENKTNEEYDCLVAVSGGKDSTTILRKLFECHGIKKALLVRIDDCFSKTQAGRYNLENILNRFNCDLLTVRINPHEFKKHILNDFVETLNPLKWLEEQIYRIPLEIAKKYSIKLVFYGENPYFEYGSSEHLDIFHPESTEFLRIIYLGAIHSYNELEWYKLAAEVGFVDLNYYNEWQRQGNIENYSQIDSLGYLMGIWTKFVKFGFQRVTDISTRKLRNGELNFEQVQTLIKERDYICDPTSKRDFCRAIDIKEKLFDEIVDKHANLNLVCKDNNNIWRRKDLI